MVGDLDGSWVVDVNDYVSDVVSAIINVSDATIRVVIRSQSKHLHNV